MSSLMNREEIEAEHALARDIFEHFMRMNNTSSGNVRYHTSPTTTYNGDIFLCARSPMDSLYLFIGDLTGHGLPAAVASVPINKIFFTMASKGIAISSIAKEINQTLYHLLPDNIFCAGCLLEMSLDGKQIKLWSGGMPAIIVTDPNGKRQSMIRSMHMPLGSQTPAEFESNIQTLQMEHGKRLYLFTDGITDLQKKNSQLFGEESMRRILSHKNEHHFDQIVQEVDQFKVAYQHDDITLVELKAQPLQWPTSNREEWFKQRSEKLKHALPWEISMHVSGHDFQRGDPASQIINFLSNATGLDMHQDTLSIILTELYSNAIEHGLMRLDSSLKSSEEGFVKYYLSRSEGIRKISSQDDYVDIHVKFDPDRINPVITIRVTDSGNGFDPDSVRLSDENDLYGRGQKLLHSLCRDLVYSHGGRTATATYELLRPTGST